MITLFDDFLSVYNHDAFVMAVDFLASEVIDCLLTGVVGLHTADACRYELQFNLVYIGIRAVDGEAENLLASL